MTKIDYSQFYYKPNARADVEDYSPYRESKVPRKGRSGKKRLLAFVTAICILTAAFFGVNYYFNGGAVEAVKDMFTGSDHADYFLVVKIEDSRDKANAHSLLARQGGAGGYIYADKEKFNVIYTVFKDEADAKSVSEKNSGSSVVKITLRSKDKRVYKVITESVDALISACTDYEKGTIYETQLLEIYAALRAEIITLKQKLYDENHAEQNAMDFLLGGLDSKPITSGTRIEVTSSIRFTSAGTVINYSRANS